MIFTLTAATSAAVTAIIIDCTASHTNDIDTVTSNATVHTIFAAVVTCTAQTNAVCILSFSTQMTATQRAWTISATVIRAAIAAAAIVVIHIAHMVMHQIDIFW